MTKENETKKVKGYPVAESDGRYYIDTTQGVQERLVWSQEERDGIYIIVDEMDDEIQLLVDESTYADAYDHSYTCKELLYSMIADIYTVFKGDTEGKKIVKGYSVSSLYGQYYILGGIPEYAEERLVWSDEVRKGIYVVVNTIDDDIELHVDIDAYDNIYDPMCVKPTMEERIANIYGDLYYDPIDEMIKDIYLELENKQKENPTQQPKGETMKKLMFANLQEAEEKLEERLKEKRAEEEITKKNLESLRGINQAVQDIIYPMPLLTFREVMLIPLFLENAIPLGVKIPKPLTYISTVQEYFYATSGLRDLDINIFMEKINEVVVKEQIKVEEDEINNYQGLVSRIVEIGCHQTNQKTINIYQLKHILKEAHEKYIKVITRHCGPERVEEAVEEYNEIWGNE